MEAWESTSEVKAEQLGNLKSHTVDKKAASVHFQFDNGIMDVIVVSKEVFRVKFTTKNEFLDIPSFAVIAQQLEDSYEVSDRHDSVVISTTAMSVEVSKCNGSITVRDSSGKIISKDYEAAFEWSRNGIRCKKSMEDSTHFYGLGEKTGYLDKRGRKYTMWNTDEPSHLPTKDPLYKSIPFLICFNEENTYGIFMDKTCKSFFNLGEESKEYYSFEADDFEMDYYFICGPEIKDVVKSYTNLTGRMSLPPKWALGYQQCRWSYDSEKYVMEIAEKFREKKIPCDVLYLDIDYMDEYRVFTWNKDRFPNPKKMLDTLRKDGFKVVTIIDPGVKKDAEYDVYLEGIRKGLFCKNAEGAVYHGKVWPGDAAYPDFSKSETRTWWGEKNSVLFKDGVNGIWNDMNEPSDFAPETDGNRELSTVPNDIIMDNDGHPRTFRRYHNSYGFNMCRGTYEGFEKFKSNERPFILTRSAYAGIQRYSAVWTGDNSSYFEHMAMAMPMHMNIGLSGVAFVGGDVGGFQENASSELFVRWLQLGVFTPFFRAHSAIRTNPHEPWSFGKEAEDICRKYIELRYKLLPYNYNEFYKASTTGLPIMKPLVINYPKDSNVYNMCDEFLYGDSILVAPVYRPSTVKRCVYLPKGTWYNYWTEEKYDGGKYILSDCPLDILPIFIKQGSIIPSTDVVNYVGERDIENLYLDIYPDDNFEYSFYEDDGESKGYLKGEYNLTYFKGTRDSKNIELSVENKNRNYVSSIKCYTVRLHNIDKAPIGVNCFEDKVDYKFDKAKHILEFKLKDIDDNKKINVMF